MDFPIGRSAARSHGVQGSNNRQVWMWANRGAQGKGVLNCTQIPRRNEAGDFPVSITISSAISVTSDSSGYCSIGKDNAVPRWDKVLDF
jgi:hypothetical protein